MSLAEQSLQIEDWIDSLAGSPLLSSDDVRRLVVLAGRRMTGKMRTELARQLRDVVDELDGFLIRPCLVDSCSYGPRCGGPGG